MLVKPYLNDPMFKDGLSPLNVDRNRFKQALKSNKFPKGLIILDVGAFPGTG